MSTGATATAPAGATTVLFANNYDMARARAGWRAGVYPAHHLYGTAELCGAPELYGTPELDGAFTVVDLPFHGNHRLTRLTRHKLGDIGQQLAVIAASRQRAVVYGAAAQELRGLVALRAARAFFTPIVGVFHSPPAPGSHRALALRGFDRAIALSEHTRRGMVSAGIAPERITVLGWGADLDFPGFAPRLAAAADAPVVATGKTGRDLATLLAALRATGLPARVYGERYVLARSGPIPANVSIRPVSSFAGEPPAPLRYDEAVTADLRAAALVAIPLSSIDRLTGLTEIVDALACGRPLIVTRSPYFDFDIERIGCGWWVAPGDVRGWSELLTAAMADRERLEAMGRAGREWSERHLNARLFAAGVRQVLEQARADAVTRRGRQ